MEKIVPPEPYSANDYDDRTTVAVKSVLVEIGQILGSYKGKFAVIGGAVPWLLIENEEMRHVGTLDIDLSLDAEALCDGEYATLVGSLMASGYEQQENRRYFQLIRQVPATDDGAAIDVIIDFLIPRDAEYVKNDPPIIAKFAAQRADGAELALHFKEMVAIQAPMPNGGNNRIEIAVASIPAFLAMKGHAINNRYKNKDAYDIYYCIRNFSGGIKTLADLCKPLLKYPSGLNGYKYIAEKFNSPDGFGPTCVRNFVNETQIMGDRTADQWQVDAFGQVNEWVRSMKIEV